MALDASEKHMRWKRWKRRSSELICSFPSTAIIVRAPANIMRPVIWRAPVDSLVGADQKVRTH